MISTASSTHTPGPLPVNEEDDGYARFLDSLRTRFAAATAGDARLFTTSTLPLFETFLAHLPPERRQHYTCNACRRFIDRFGGLVTILPDGAAVSVLWGPDRDDVPDFFRGAVLVMRDIVRKADVTGVFLCEEKVWGLPSNRSSVEGGPAVWCHMAVVPQAGLVFKPTLLLSTLGVMAEKLQDHAMLTRALVDYDLETVRQAHTILAAGDVLYRAEKCLGVAKWLLELHERAAATKNVKHTSNLLWLAVAAAPAGFCHVRSSMIGTLLEDIKEGLPFDDIKARFDAKMNPLQYQRPQAPPTAGNIAQAEKIVATLQTAGALSRRFARLEDIQALWKPAPAQPSSPAKDGGVFGHLKVVAKREAAVELPPITMTWIKFAADVLPSAQQLEFFVPGGRTSFAALVTAVDPEAPPILQWDLAEARNPVSWYFYNGGSTAAAWKLTPHTYCPVTAVTLLPTMWGGADKFAHHGAQVFFLLKGAIDSNITCGGWFPEFLKSEYHGVRATLEAHAKANALEGRLEATANGLGLGKGNSWSAQFRVTANGATRVYKLDRWD